MNVIEEHGRTEHSPDTKKDSANSIQPPLTPMIDVTFQLLLYFLLTTEFREDEGQIPGSICGPGISSQPILRSPTVSITLRSTGVVPVMPVRGGQSSARR